MAAVTTSATAAAERERAEAATRASRSARPAPKSAKSARPQAAKPVKPFKPTKPVKPAKPTKPARVRPVAGLTQTQMDNARAIVVAGVKRKVPKRAVIIAVATAMQESTLLNRASEVLPESKRYPHQGTGADHDSVGLFQQRTSSGWGSVANLMKPDYAAGRFYAALLQVPGWQRMPVTAAAQAVQVSAYPDAYAKHEARATKIVTTILPTV